MTIMTLPRLTRWIAFAVLACVVSVLILPPLALGLVPGPAEPVPIPDGPAAGGFIPLYLVGLSALSPLVGYLLNHYVKFIRSEPVKGVIQAVLAAGVGVLYQAVTPDDLGLNDQTLYAVLTAMVSALLAHFGYKAALVNVALGGGTNKDGTVSDPKVLP